MQATPKEHCNVIDKVKVENNVVEKCQVIEEQKKVAMLSFNKTYLERKNIHVKLYYLSV